MTGEYTASQPAAQAELGADTEVQRIQSILAKIGLASQTELALVFKPKVRDPQTNEWVPRINPKTDTPISMPALLPIERIDQCPVPLATFSDEDLASYLKSANTYRLSALGEFDAEGNYIREDPVKKDRSIKAGEFMLQQSVEMKKES